MARGSVTPRRSKDGKRVSYRIKWETRGPNGERVYHSATRATKKAADAFLVDKLKEVGDGTFVRPTNQTVETFLRRWLETLTPDLSESTAYEYGCRMRGRIIPHIGAMPLARLDAITLQEFYADLARAGYAPHSVAATHSMLASALEQAVAWRLLSRSPADDVKAPTARVPAPKVWQADEAIAFLAATADDPMAPLWRLGLDSGMRLGEMLALAWRDVNLDTAVVSVRRTLTRSKTGGYMIGELAKTTSSRRSILIGPTTTAALRTLYVPQLERRLACGGAWHDLDIVFDRGNGLYLSPVTVERRFARAVHRAGVPELTPHGMRHTMATMLLAAGIHPKIVQERLGHKSIQMTLDRYSHVITSMQQEAAASLDRILGEDARPIRGHGA
jgi:integrase